MTPLRRGPWPKSRRIAVPTRSPAYGPRSRAASSALSLAGEFDHYTSAPLRRLLGEGAARGARRLVLDTALVTFCDSALLHALDQWARGGGRVELATVSRSVRLLLTTAARVRHPVPGGPFSG
ncbi:STAS domain-containing protein [Streptomyces xanthophaeus]|uniref:STAS domain-containing protein n=1 Tax=Streptomyces xanthophaeus TaxID=67385 RepID=UPI00365EC128